VPTLIQFPVWIGLYQSILAALAATPENLMNLSRHLYPNLSQVHELVPLDSRFLWLDLAVPDQFFLLPILVAGSGWLQQKMSTMPTDDPRQQQMNNTMQWMMPMMFGFFTVSFASGLAIYWFISNVISIAVQYFVTGWGSLTWFSKGNAVPSTTTEDDSAEDSVEPEATKRERTPRRRSRSRARRS
jgi:YidC/Oxa1 family membrane protein insertase